MPQQTSTINILLVCQNGWWTAVSKKLGIGGSGESEAAAIKAFKRSWLSHLKQNNPDTCREVQATLPIRPITGSGQWVSTRSVRLSQEEYATIPK
jgi:hypothetical protein